jgi:plasmid stabilization system protein ParE
MTNNELERKPADITNRCLRMLDEAIEYYKEKAPAQAEILKQHFFKSVKLLEIMPGIGTKHKKGTKKIQLGKFRRYNIYYREKETEIEVLGIWHTSRGTDFEEP